MKGDDGPGIDHVTLTLRGPGRRHRLDPQANVSEFAGYLFDERHAYRRLLSGEVSIEPTDPRENVRITLDLSFANGVTMRGVSTCPVRGRVDP